MKRTITERRLSRHPYKGRNSLWGRCYTNGAIDIDPRLKPRDYMDTLIHELLHREISDLSEECVTATATMIADALWEKKFRSIRHL